MGTRTAAGGGQDRRKITSRKVVGLPAGLDPADDSLALWAGRYLDLAVHAIRSPEVEAKIALHLTRFRDWFTDGFGHDRISAVTTRDVTAWRDHLAANGNTNTHGTPTPMAPTTVNNHLAHLSALFTWVTAHAPGELLPHGDPTARVEALPLPAPEPRALADPQVRTIKNVLDRIEGFHRLNGRRHRDSGQTTLHRHARPLRDRSIVYLLLGTGLRRTEVVNLDLDQVDPCDHNELRRVKKARLAGVRGKGRTSRTVFLGRDTRSAIADYLERERPGDTDQDSAALFLSASSIAARRPDGRLSPRSINTIVGQVGRLHDLEVTGPDRQIGALRPHDLRHTFAYQLSETSGHNRAELERRLGHANDRYLKLYTNPPEDIAASYVENL